MVFSQGLAADNDITYQHCQMSSWWSHCQTVWSRFRRTCLQAASRPWPI